MKIFMGQWAYQLSKDGAKLFGTPVIQINESSKNSQNLRKMTH